MEMGSFRPELHVAQQSRRDKLRVAHHLQDLEQNPDLVHVRNVNNAHNLLYDPYSSEIINFSTKSNFLSAQRDIMDAGEDAGPFPNWSSNSNNIIVNALSKSPIEPPNYGNWVVSYASGSGESNNIFGEVSNNISSSPGYNIGFHQDHVRSSCLKGFTEAQNMRASDDGGNNNNNNNNHNHNHNKPALLAAAYGNESSDVLCFDNAGGAWPNRAVDSCHHQWSSGDSNPQALSLSLSSSNPALKLPGAHQFGESQDLHSTSTTTVSKCCGKSLQDIVGISTNINTSYRNTGPLGPFTGYATILKASKFLKPAQQLLDEFCGMSERASGEVSTSGDALNAAAAETHELASAAAASSSTYFTCNEMSCDGGVGSSSSESIRPEFQQKKAKLLYMQEEVCRRYKQYHQQMQMVVSSFESVAGLSCATPYISLALKSVSRHFRCLKNAISEQLKHIGKALGEDLSSPTTATTSTNKGDTNMVMRLKHLDQSSLQRQRYNVGFLDTTQQHVWRPQRGLPERSVAILRAWLFEHFLHPYPTDTDKHMLATQTGLSRNQVSNWFINARVRVWKPMVEEIHTLETKAEANKNIEGSSSSSSINKRLECEWKQQEKRSRMNCEIETSMDGSGSGSGSLMGFLPYQPTSGAAVSLTLGLRHGAENVNVQHLQLQQQQLQEDQFGGRIIRDFVG